MAVKLLPTWRRWLAHSLPHIEGPRVLEVSPGTGWLLTWYAAHYYEVHAIDLNRALVDTMAFTGYPDGRRALSEMVRVLRPRGRLVIIDVNYPSDGNRAGSTLLQLWKRSGAVIRDIRALFGELGLEGVDREIGGFGSVHLYIATKPG